LVVLGLATGIVSLAWVYVASWPATLIGFLLLVNLVYLWRRETRWRLRWVPAAQRGWQYAEDGGEWRDTQVRCDYLGPWLIGLRVAGRRRWLWPDSTSREEHRTLRRLLLWQMPWPE
jgi:hypothetical protein